MVDAAHIALTVLQIKGFSDNEIAVPSISRLSRSRINTLAASEQMPELWMLMDTEQQSNIIESKSVICTNNSFSLPSREETAKFRYTYMKTREGSVVFDAIS